ncbi:MAG: biotin transporter BioY [Candidatus Omnitrophota bacterium]
MRAISLPAKNIMVRDTSLVFSFSVLMALSSFVRIPLIFTPVPLTLQTFVLYLSLVFLKRKAVYAQGIYLLLGIAGLPVFTNAGSGLLYFSGPTAGYLFGFIFVAGIFPFFAPRKNTYFTNLCFFSLAALCLYSSGIAWLMIAYKFTLSGAFIAGAFPFIFGEIFKIGLASAIKLRAARGFDPMAKS